MKYLITLSLLFFSTLYYSQTNNIKIMNFSSHDIPIVVISVNPSATAQDCVPIIYNETPVVLPAGESVSYSQHNLSMTSSLPINVWHFVAGNYDKLYDLSLGQMLAQTDTDLVTWSQAIIYAPNGQQYRLGIGCQAGGFTSFTAGGITADLSFLSGDAIINITD